MLRFIWFLFFTLIFLGDGNCQEKYLDYLKDNYFTPEEYLNNQFLENDLVILCEREHPELTQYDFFFDIVSKDWFIDKVGTVICEVATRSIQPQIDSILYAKNLSKKELNQRLININRNMSHHKYWPHKNFYNFLKNIYYLNQTLTYDKKVRLLGADIPMNWDKITSKQERRAYEKEYFPKRDKYMADFILDWYKEDTNKKALIIMNTRHAFMNFSYRANENKKRKIGKSIRLLNNVGAFIRYKLPDKSTNVMLNSFTYNRFFKYRQRIANGKWDKSFYRNNNLPCGLSLKNSPFGKDDFDYFPYVSTNLQWKDVFDHLIFYNPLCDFISSTGINGLIEKDIESEMRRRLKILNNRFLGTFIVDRKLEKINIEQETKYRFRKYCRPN